LRKVYSKLEVIMLSEQRWQSDLDTLTGDQLYHLLKLNRQYVKPEWALAFSKVGDVKEAAGLTWTRIEDAHAWDSSDV
jgi:hypothetical protein